MDIMLDLETLGVRCGSVILSIGACTFDRNAGYYGDLCFHQFLKLGDQIGMGATMDPSTVMWWLAQSDHARKAMIDGQDQARPTGNVLADFDRWLDMVCPEVPARIIWANGQDFDIALLNELYKKLGRNAPWPYNAARDMRTVLDVAGGHKPAFYKSAPTGAHDALVDAIYQADVLALALKRIYSPDNGA